MSINAEIKNFVQQLRKTNAQQRLNICLWL